MQKTVAFVFALFGTHALAYHEANDDDAADNAGVPGIPGGGTFPADGCNCAAFGNGTNSSLMNAGSGDFAADFDDQFDGNLTNGTCAPDKELTKCQQDDADKQASYDGRRPGNPFPR